MAITRQLNSWRSSWIGRGRYATAAHQ